MRPRSFAVTLNQQQVSEVRLTKNRTLAEKTLTSLPKEEQEARAAKLPNEILRGAAGMRTALRALRPDGGQRSSLWPGRRSLARPAGQSLAWLGRRCEAPPSDAALPMPCASLTSTLTCRRVESCPTHSKQRIGFTSTLPRDGRTSRSV